MSRNKKERAPEVEYDYMEYAKVFHDNLEKLIAEHDWAQQSVADIIGCTSASFTKWRSGEACPNFKSLVGLAVVFNVSLDELVGLNIEKKKNKRGKK